MADTVARWVRWTTIGSIAFALLLALDAHPYLRGGFGWRWPHIPVAWPAMAVLIASAALYVAGAAWLHGRRGALVWAFSGAVALGFVGAWARGDGLLGYTLFTRTASKMTTGPHHAAAVLDLDREMLIAWDDLMASYDPDDDEAATVSRHVMLAPPAIPLLFEWTAALLSRAPALADALQRPLIAYQCQNYAVLGYPPAVTAAAWLGMLLPVWAALTVLPLHSAANQLRLDADAVALWWPLVPMAASFAGSWNTVYPLLAVWAFALLMRGGAWAVVGGAVTGYLVWMNFAPVPLGLLMGWFVLLRWWLHERESTSFARPLRIGALYGAGVVAFWGAWMLYGGPSPWAMLGASFGAHLDLDRPYWAWVFLHVYDWLLFAGVPLIVASLWAMRRRETLGNVMAWALWLSLIILALSGTARGETARVWSFFTPFALLSAGAVVARRDWLWLTVAQAAMWVALVGTWGVFDAGDMPRIPESPYTLDGSGAAVNARFDAGFTLSAWDATPDADSIALTLDWYNAERTVTPYWFAALLVGPEGTPVGDTVIWQGGDTRYPTTCWAAGESVRDRVSISMPSDAMDGDYWLSLSVFADEDTPSVRVPVTLADGTNAEQVGLGPIRWGD